MHTIGLKWLQGHTFISLLDPPYADTNDITKELLVAQELCWVSWWRYCFVLGLYTYSAVWCHLHITYRYFLRLFYQAPEIGLFYWRQMSLYLTRINLTRNRHKYMSMPPMRKNKNNPSCESGQAQVKFSYATWCSILIWERQLRHLEQEWTEFIFYWLDLRWIFSQFIAITNQVFGWKCEQQRTPIILNEIHEAH